MVLRVQKSWEILSRNESLTIEIMTGRLVLREVSGVKILGVDPGKTTGIALFSDEKFIVGYEISDYSQLETILSNLKPDVVVVENFLINTRRPSHASYPLKFLGVVEYLCSTKNVTLVVQSPSVLSKMLSKVEDVHPSPHVRSAAAHVYYYIRRVDNAKRGAKKR